MVLLVVLLVAGLTRIHRSKDLCCNCVFSVIEWLEGQMQVAKNE